MKKLVDSLKRDAILYIRVPKSKKEFLLQEAERRETSLSNLINIYMEEMVEKYKDK